MTRVQSVGVECTVEGLTPIKMKTTMNNHYNGTFVEPWGERVQRGYAVCLRNQFLDDMCRLDPDETLIEALILVSERFGIKTEQM